MPKKILASILFIAACGNPPPNNPDGGGGPATNVAAIVLGADGPQAGVEVVFVDKDGKVAADVKTGDDGRAEATIAAGASVTAAVDGLTTVLGVDPGNTVTFGPHADPAAGDELGTLEIDFAAQTGATSYAVSTRCGSATAAAPPLKLPIHASCPSHLDLLVTASDANGLISYRAAATSFDAKKPTYAFDPKKTDWTPIDTIALDLGGMDANQIAPVDVAVSTATGQTLDHATLPATNPTANASLHAALGAAASFAMKIDDPSGAHHQVLLQPIDPSASDVHVDMSKDLLAWVKSAAYDAKTRTASVTTSAGDQGQLLEIDLSYGAKAWHAFGPSTGSIALPTLPTSLASLGPSDSDTVTATATLLDVGDNKYDQLRYLAPYAAFFYAGHPEIATLQRVRLSK